MIGQSKEQPQELMRLIGTDNYTLPSHWGREFQHVQKDSLNADTRKKEYKSLITANRLRPLTMIAEKEVLKLDHMSIQIQRAHTFGDWISGQDHRNRVMEENLDSMASQTYTSVGLDGQIKNDSGPPVPSRLFWQKPNLITAESELAGYLSSRQSRGAT